ncbi:hypothetical protein HanIR_Chr14g0701051 [Helianthus annuus]|nr:hypothetical protein HanIR_Chr14g0701051 [Helianthus annuus]KAJ0485916.1 hypothetical protein HanHA89_Chr14g0573751 [Helianthus annuus]KAJ0656469.1 hypothetical protein HanLR1_Chr14g0536151 [Helianthus annuus]
MVNNLPKTQASVFLIHRPSPHCRSHLAATTISNNQQNVAVNRSDLVLYRLLHQRKPSCGA